MSWIPLTLKKKKYPVAMIIVACLLVAGVRWFMREPVDISVTVEKAPIPSEAIQEPPTTKPPAIPEAPVVQPAEASRLARDFREGIYEKRDIVQQRVKAFEDWAVLETPTANILVETFGARIGGSSSGSKTPAGMEDLRLDVPGYVAVMPTQDALNEGISTSFEQVANLYFIEFPEAPRVTVALLQGGGVRGSYTYQNRDGEAVPAEQRYHE